MIMHAHMYIAMYAYLYVRTKHVDTCTYMHAKLFFYLAANNYYP